MSKRFKLIKIIQETEELHWNGGSNEEETHSKQDETPKLLSRTKDFVHKVLKNGWSFDQTDNAENLEVDRRIE